MASNQDFVIELDGRAGAFALHIECPAGEHTDEVALDSDAIRAELPALQTTVLASASRTRALVPELERPARRVGVSLFEALFGSTAGALLLSSRQQAETRGERLRVVLHLRSPELSVLPWELLFNERFGGYLCRRSSLVRYVEAVERVAPLMVDPPLRILGMTALPAGLAGLDAEGERQRLREGLAGLIERDLVTLDWVDGESWAALQRRLYDGCHVFHFIGHGGYDPSRQEGLVAFADDDGGQHLVSATSLADLLSLATPGPRLVVLNSCETGVGSAADVFSSTAAVLIRSGVPAVVAMQFAITDHAAKAFSGAFYEALANRRDVDESVRAGRIRVLGSKNDTLEWATPVLYLRSTEARLFNFPAEAATAEAATAEAGQGEGLEQQRLAASAAYWSANRSGKWERAIELLAALRTREAGNPDTERMYADARLAARYQLGRQAEDDGDLLDAETHYRAVVEIDSTYKDASGRATACRTRHETEALLAELRALYEIGEYEAVLGISERLATLDPAAADPEGKASEAQRRLAGAGSADPEAAKRQSESPAEPTAKKAPAKRPSRPKTPSGAPKSGRPETTTGATRPTTPSKAKQAATTRRQRIEKALAPLKGATGVYFGNEIAKGRLDRIRPAANVPANEKILVLVDLSVLPNGKSALLFGTRGIYNRNVGETATMTYDQLRGASITNSSWRGTIKVGDIKLSVGGMSCPATLVIKVLETLQKELETA